MQYDRLPKIASFFGVERIFRAIAYRMNIIAFSAYLYKTSYEPWNGRKSPKTLANRANTPNTHEHPFWVFDDIWQLIGKIEYFHFIIAFYVYFSLWSSTYSLIFCNSESK